MRCKEKNRYRTQKKAIVAASLALRNKNSNTRKLRVYQCPECDGWHLTSKV